MKDIFKTILCALAMFSFASCSNDDIVPDTPEQPSVSKYEQLTFSSADEPSTRAMWSDEKGSGSLVFNWEADDKGTELLVCALGSIGYDIIVAARGKRQHGQCA